ncbi:BamA/TamA family outer membrane protein [Reichenbachiella agarivorans]|uniref:BamA/TamA family outer membrane protein n=1 Tax=Reichenbachiella agarivorans TaxID=2979464 RepID=A0ABY6CQH9_9BACT|nr:BamA/TamA family outer membrane protein [Reichenbachiella agarivorans]UXP32751.1 BamA/TamA family outer membrane protein [Reichenbachiella agarivorans]
MHRLPLLVLFVIFSTMVVAQSSQGGQHEPDSIKKVDFTVMPYLSYNRNLKLMIGAIPMSMYKLNKDDIVSQKSLSGISAIYTTNGSYFVALFNRFFFAEDKWRAKFFAFGGDYYSQFFMDDFEFPGFYDYGTKVYMASGSIQRQLFNKLYAGVSYTYAHYNTNYEDDVLPESITETNGLEINALHDSRNAFYYPSHGKKINLRWINYGEWFGNDVTSNKVVAEYNQYFSTRQDKDVFAARFSGQFGVGDIAFQQQQTLGGKDIRGYSEGKYRGDGIMALQGEYRFNFREKMGVVGFAGLATLYGSDTDDFNWKLYPGLGVGYRYRAFKTVKFNIGLDAAVGKDDWSLNFRIGESF